jgi:outer membrane protein TolC
LLLCAAVAAQAETLEDAWRAALAGDAALQAAQARESAAAEGLEAARAARRPRLDATAAASRWRDVPTFDFGAAGVTAQLPLFPGDSITVATASVSIPLYTGGTNTANVKSAASMLAAQGHATSGLTQTLKLAVADAYFGVLRATSALEAAQAAEASLSAHARDVQDLVSNGEVPMNDYLAAAVSLADARHGRLLAENAVAIASATYNRRLGRPLDAAVDLEPQPPSIAAAEAAANALGELVAMALVRRHELAGLADEMNALLARADAARGERRPQIAATGGYTFIENAVLTREDFWSVGIGVRWNAFDGGRTRHAAAALTQQSSATARARTDLRSAIELEVRTAWLDVGATRARVAVTESAVAQAEENVRVVGDRYRNGEGTNTEVLDAESLRLLTRDNFDDARFDAILAELTLARSVGLL